MSTNQSRSYFAFLLLISAAAVLLSPFSVHAELIRQPAELEAGDQYRLVFLTSTVRDATSTDINVYNDFVQSAADASPVLSTWGFDWNAIASTESVDAIDNTATDFGSTLSLGLPVYLVDGTKITSNYFELWRFDFHRPPINVDELGTNAGREVWTGTNRYGSGTKPLGGASNPWVGRTNGFYAFDWTEWVTRSHTGQIPMYAMSQVLTATAVPEPSSFLCVGILFSVVLAYRRVR